MSNDSVAFGKLFKFKIIESKQHKYSSIFSLFNFLQKKIFFQEWKYSSFKDVNCKVVQLLNEALEITFKNRTYSICDAYLAAAFIFPEKCIRQSQDRFVTIELHGHHSRGQMIVDHSGKTAKISNVTIIEQLDEDEIKKALIWTANA